MESEGNLLRKVNITINQDWTELRKLYHEYNQKILTASPTDVIDFYNPTGITYQVSTYDFLVNDYPLRVIHHDEGISNNTLWLEGAYLHSMFPWYKNVFHLFWQKLNFTKLVYAVNYHGVKLHIDQEYHKLCKLMYIISTDDFTANTIVYDAKNPSVKESFISIPKQTHLVDMKKAHEVHCNGKREVLQFWFQNDYEEVSTFLKAHEPLIF
jgi:hypothetical protein